MKKIKKIMLIFLMVILTVTVIVFFMLRGEPKITIDYLAEYNKISKLIDFDPNQNAQNLYSGAVNTFFKKPLKLAKISTEWPLDLNQAEENLLQSWLTANKESLQKFKEASKKPYYWIESRALDNDLRGIQIFELYGYGLGELYDAILWDAKVNAVNGKYSDAFENLLTYYCAVFQKCDTSRFIIVFRDNVQSLQRVTRATLLILKKIDVPESTLGLFQKDLEILFDTSKVHPDLAADKLFTYDILQRIYVYKSDGSGRLSWTGIKDFSGYDPSCVVGSWGTIKFFLAGPTQKEVKGQIDSYYEQVQNAFIMTPWQLNQRKPNFFENLYRPRFDSLFLLVYAGTYRKDYYDFYDTQAQLKALVATIAILRFQQDKGRLPNNFDELIRAGYLKELPADPYSDKPLVYDVEEEGFKIYSVGENFTDDSGKRGTDDIVFWPPWERPKYSDPNQPLENYSD
ncbi:MAG: hypothetical protein CVV39_00305 [Planctomycetes bacterium HGW-Planctomycetes-1]|nr:MAG: hypothetical protein CVV39_00305 [Planctomycetes bacterium HGW-Planctomycetes-1]